MTHNPSYPPLILRGGIPPLRLRGVRGSYFYQRQLLVQGKGYRSYYETVNNLGFDI
jgi:hypothetical protein